MILAPDVILHAKHAIRALQHALHAMIMNTYQMENAYHAILLAKIVKDQLIIALNAHQILISMKTNAIHLVKI